MTGSIPPSQTAERSGFSLDTLRYYERVGLLSDISRAPAGSAASAKTTSSGWRCCAACATPACPSPGCSATRSWPGRVDPTLSERLCLPAEHDAQVGERIAALQAQRQHLREKIDWYRGQLPANASCPAPA